MSGVQKTVDGYSDRLIGHLLTLLVHRRRGYVFLVGFPNDPSKKPFDHCSGAVLLLHDFQNQ